MGKCDRNCGSCGGCAGVLELTEGEIQMLGTLGKIRVVENGETKLFLEP
jgi:hypothetical protein